MKFEIMIMTGDESVALSTKLEYCKIEGGTGLYMVLKEPAEGHCIM